MIIYVNVAIGQASGSAELVISVLNLSSNSAPLVAAVTVVGLHSTTFPA